MDRMTGDSGANLFGNGVERVLDAVRRDRGGRFVEQPQRLGEKFAGFLHSSGSGHVGVDTRPT